MTRTAPLKPAPEPRPDDQNTRPRPEPKRINVAVTPETVHALERVMEIEGVSLTDAVRRLVGYGDFIYQAVKVQGSQVLLKDGDSTREIVLL